MSQFHSVMLTQLATIQKDHTTVLVMMVIREMDLHVMVNIYIYYSNENYFFNYNVSMFSFSLFNMNLNVCQILQNRKNEIDATVDPELFNILQTDVSFIFII